LGELKLGYIISQKALKTQIICWRRVCFLADISENAKRFGKLKFFISQISLKTQKGLAS